MTHSYNPAQVNDRGLNQMRFELGDVLVAEPERDAFLSDEEILAVLNDSRSFKHAQLRLVESLIARFSYEVDTKVHEAEWKLSDRVAAWRDLHKRLKAELDAEDFAQNGFLNRQHKPPIFTRGMFDNRRLL